jgi:hypothetical protein
MRAGYRNPTEHTRSHSGFTPLPRVGHPFGRGMFRAHPNTGIFVNLNNPNTGDGSLGNPFHLLQDAINAQTYEAPIFILTGTYQQGPVTFSKRGAVRTWNGPVVIR